MPKITDVEIRMYKMGTGDCFAIKLLSQGITVFKLMIDAGTWQGSKEKLTPFIQNLKTYLDNKADVLIVTHEHKDHVHAFAACEELFTDGTFEVGEIWMGWTENDRKGKVKDWKEDYGEKKKALGLATRKLQEVMNSDDYKKQFAGSKDADKMLGARKVFAGVLNGFADLHMSLDEATNLYKGGLAGMDVVKEKIPKTRIRYHKPGDMIQDLGEAEGVKIYVLGPPQLYDEVRKEAGGEGESYTHNKKLKESEAFSAAVLNMDNNGFVKGSLLPFDEHFFESNPTNPSVVDAAEMEMQKKLDAVKVEYDKDAWRKIDYDWMFSAGSFALRMNGLTNNLSLALAIEFGDDGKVLLFPGDAEYGSWDSWHRIPWKQKGIVKKDGKEIHFTEDLLNRTVFYKVAHHLSHNGTAQRQGLEMMKSTDLAAMATLDYSVINEGWMSTMPNRALIKELLTRTKGRLMIMNEEGLFFDFNGEVPIADKLEEARAMMSTRERQDFEGNFDFNDPHYLQYTVRL
jgi:hypothetical protein